MSTATTTEALPFEVVRTAPNVARINVPVESDPDWRFWVFLQSDVHFDNPHCQLDEWRRHRNQAIEKRALVIDGGDFFCAMQGKYDKRANKSDLRPEHQAGNYLDRLVDTAAEELAPIAHQLAMLPRGNHDQAIFKRHETDLVDRTCDRLRMMTGAGVEPGGVQNWIWFQFTAYGTQRHRRVMYQHHGAGGGGPVTKGMIASNRRSAMLSGVDYVMSGHIHEQWTATIPQYYLDEHGKERHRDVTHLQVGTYKEEALTGGVGYHVDNHRPPKPLGGQWMEFRWERQEIRMRTYRAD